MVLCIPLRYFKTVHGVQVQELVEGEGEAAARGSTVVIDYVLRRANGYAAPTAMCFVSVVYLETRFSSCVGFYFNGLDALLCTVCVSELHA